MSHIRFVEITKMKKKTLRVQHIVPPHRTAPEQETEKREQRSEDRCSENFLFTLQRVIVAAMNPAQYKQAMRQRALERRAELSREAAASTSERSLGVPHPPRTDACSTLSTGQVPKLELQGNDVDGDSAATSPATCSSSAGGGGWVEGFCVQDQVRKERTPLVKTTRICRQESL